MIPALSSSERLFDSTSCNNNQMDISQLILNTATCQHQGLAMPVSAQTELHCRLLELPPEMLAQICDLAYLDDSEAIYATRAKWEKRERRRKNISGPQYTKPPFPSKATDLLVCKQYFAAAAKALVRNLNVGNRNFGMGIERPNYFVYDEILSPALTGIISAYVTEVQLHWSETAALAKLSSLRRLDLYVDDEAFESLVYPVWECELSEHDFESLEFCTHIRALSRIDWFKLRATLPYGWRDNESACKFWDYNTQRLRQWLIAGIAGAPKDPSTRTSLGNDNEAANSLYPGSKVCFGRSTLLTCLRDEDVPVTIGELGALWAEQPQAILDWIRSAKLRLQNPHRPLDSPSDYWSSH